MLGELLLECVSTFQRKGGVRLAYVEECSGATRKR